MNHGKHKDILLSCNASQPLTSEEQSKLLMFALLMLPSIGFGVGIIPTIFLCFGLYMMKKNQDFSSIDVAVKNFKRYTVLVVIIGGAIFIFNFVEYISRDWGLNYLFEKMLAGFCLSLISYFHFFLVQYFFYVPLKSHSDWVVVNDIFSSKFKSISINKSESELNIIKGEKLKQYSVADELLKWAKLKEDGHISEEEFNEARAKLLKKN